MKVSELEDAGLDVWAARAAGEENPQVSRPGGSCYVKNGHTISAFRPSSEWRHGGPLIEREQIAIEPVAPGVWSAEKWTGADGTREDRFVTHNGATPLEAAMRVFVAAKFGEEVPSNVEVSGATPKQL